MNCDDNRDKPASAESRQTSPEEAAHGDMFASRRVQGSIEFEPVGSGVRVTARDGEHRLLWGYIGAKENVREPHCLVAVYETLQGILAEELEKRGVLSLEGQDPLAAAREAVAKIEKTIQWLKDGLDVKKTSDATLDRARAIARIVSDADRQIAIEAGSLKGMRGKSSDGYGSTTPSRGK